MTAIVGVLSRNGIAFAADSAASVIETNGNKITKITYHANKIFTLSKYQPVGVALYNELDFHGIPWESIIKTYRKHLTDKEYDTLPEYISSFWDYVKQNVLPTINNDQAKYCRTTAIHLLAEAKQNALTIIGGALSDDNKEEYFNATASWLNAFATNNTSIAEDYTDYTKDLLIRNAGQIIDEVLSADLADEKCRCDLKEAFTEALFVIIRYVGYGYFPKTYTGLAFFGYGSKDFLPSCYSYKVSVAMEGRIKYVIQESNIMTNNSSPVILPLAQSDVSLTLLKSIEGKLKDIFFSKHKASLTGFRDEILKQMTDAKAPQKLLHILDGVDIDKYAKSYQKDMEDYIQNDYVVPLIDTVQFLSKEDLADLAESLVRMTSLKRRITKKDESVGGPVDVAVVTKGDGFIWMKRKHYFDPELNRQFFERYNK